MKILYTICLVLLTATCIGQINPIPLPLNQAVRYGKLENGLQYYILRNEYPEDKICVSLMVDAGVFDEEANEIQVAHIVEHLGFRSTVNFPKGLRDFFAQKGIRPHASTNSTTNYKIEIPANNPELLDAALLAVKDWAGGMLFNPGDVDEERAAVLREANQANTPYFLAIKNGKYQLLDRNPLYSFDIASLMDAPKTVRNETLVGFYQKWYHPMYQTIFIVGNIQMNEVETIIKQRYSNLTNSGYKPKQDVSGIYDVPLSGKNKLSIVEHGNNVQTFEINVFKKTKTLVSKSTNSTEERYRISIIDNFINEMTANRIKVLSQTEELSLYPKFRIEREAIHSMAKIDAVRMSITVNSVSAVKPEMTGMLKILHQLGQFGFSDEEFNLVKRNYWKLNAFSVNPTSPELMSRLQSYHLEESAFPLNEHELIAKIFSGITLTDVNNAIISWLNSEGNLDVLLSVPDLKNPLLPTESEVLRLIDNIRHEKATPYILPKVLTWPKPPANVQVEYALQEVPELHITRMKFNNGVTVVLKPTGSASVGGKVELTAFKNNIDPAGLKAATIPFASITGFNAMRVAEIKRLMAETPDVYVMPYLQDGEIKVSGVADEINKDLLFNLVYQYLAKSEPDPVAFKKYIERNQEKLKHGLNESGAARLNKSRDAIIGTRQDELIISYDKTLMAEIYETYKTKFGDASGFTFVITGYFDEKEMMNLAARYLGALPGSGKVLEKAGIKLQDKKMTRNGFQPGQEIIAVGDSVNNVNINLLFEGSCGMNVKNKLTLQLLNHSLNNILFKRLREQEKGVYSVFSNVWFGKILENFFLDISFQTAPEDVGRLTNAVKDELHRLANGSISESIFANAAEIVRGELTNGGGSFSWSEYIVQRERDHSGIYSTADDQLNQIRILDSITPKDISDFVRNYLNIDGNMIFKLL